MASTEEMASGIPMTNITDDIMEANCFKHFNTVACVRDGILTFLAVITAILCIMKIIKFHLSHHQSCHQYFIFYSASLECAIGGVHWALSNFPQLDFVLQYLKLLQFLILCHFYWTLATRALRRERLTKRFLVPLLMAACVYFTVIAILGIVNVQSLYVECLQPYWIELSAAEFATVQLFAIAGFYITRRLNEISTLDSVRWSQKRDLWCIVIVFEVSAFISLMYDLVLLIVGDEEAGCSAIFNHIQEIYSPVFLLFTVLKLLLPIWTMLFVFQPTPPASDQEDLLPGINTEEGGYASVFSHSSIDDQQYQQLYQPTDDYHSTDESSPSPSSTVQGARNVIVTVMHKSTSSLTPIKEECTSHVSSIASSVDNKDGTPPKSKFYI